RRRRSRVCAGDRYRRRARLGCAAAALRRPVRVGLSGRGGPAGAEGLRIVGLPRMVTAMIRRFLPPFLLALLAVGCASRPAEVAGPTATGTPQMQFALGSGIYRCENGVRVDVQRDTPMPGMLGLVWK